MKRLRLGLIGAEGKGRDHAHAIRESQSAVLAACCDIRADASRENGGVPFYIDPEEMLAGQLLDGLVVCVPHSCYPELLSLAARKGLSVLKEKPLARTEREGQLFGEMFDRAGVMLAVAGQRRYAAPYELARQWISHMRGVFLVDARYTFDAPGSRNFGWRAWSDVAGGGALLDMGYHVWDLLYSWFGQPVTAAVQVSAKARPDAVYDAEDTAVAILRFAKGEIAAVVLSRATCHEEEQIVIHGLDGVITVGPLQATLRDRHGNERASMSIDKSQKRAQYTRQIDDFCRSLVIGTSTELDWRHAFEVQRLIERLYSERSPVQAAGIRRSLEGSGA